MPLVYEELRLLAAQRLSHEAPGQTLQATALVHEAYLRLVGNEPQSWNSRGHFFAAAAEAMRRILVESARHKKSAKCGGLHHRIDVDKLDMACGDRSDELVRLDEALSQLAEHEPEVAQLVKLHYFAGLTMEQTAEILGISRRTAGRHWNYARLWLHREITRKDG